MSPLPSQPPPPPPPVAHLPQLKEHRHLSVTIRPKFFYKHRPLWKPNKKALRSKSNSLHSFEMHGLIVTGTDIWFLWHLPASYKFWAEKSLLYTDWAMSVMWGHHQLQQLLLLVQKKKNRSFFHVPPPLSQSDSCSDTQGSSHLSPSPARVFKVRLVWGADKELNFVLKLPNVMGMLKFSLLLINHPGWLFNLPKASWHVGA